jgi:glycosyltransferase involved in cell wall biosynthesis
MLRVSIVIPCFNAARWVRAAIDSVLAQQLEEIEVIAIDDGSTDGTAEVIATDYPQVRLFRTANRGPSAARNLGTSMATGQFIQYLDADDLLAPGKLAAQIAALETAGADVAYGDWQRLIPTQDGGFRPGPIVRREIEGPAELALFTNFWCPPAAYLFRSEIVRKVGSWNMRLPIIQDARFALDCALQGARFVYTPGVAASYRTHPSGSVSTRDPIAFVRDCLRNAAEVEQWWTAHGGIDETRRNALLEVYGGAARASFEHDRPTFEAAWTALEGLQPGYTPQSPRALALVSRLAGYRAAEAVALRYRHVKRALQLQ